MNAPIMRLFGVVILLFAVLVAFTSRWSVLESKALRDNPLNRRALLEEQRIHRGTIRAADGTLLARSVKGDAGLYARRYPPAAGPFAQTLGYSFITIGRAGLEQTQNDALTGRNDEIGTFVDQLRGKQQEGDDVITTLDPAAQRVALAGLAGRKGSVVALDPRTGAIRVMASTPGYAPDSLQSSARFKALNRDTDAPLFNRATQSGYPPGSTFKVVTAIAALDSGRYTKDSTVVGKNGIPISGVPLNNDGGESFGAVTLTTALTNSINTVWAQVGEKLGKPTMRATMERLGFDRKPPLSDLPAPQRRASGEYRNDRLLAPTSTFADVGRMAIGQDKLNVTPLQMAMVAGAVANGGKLMKPRLVARVVDKDGRTKNRIEPAEIGQAMKPSTAQAVTEMMGQVVKEGTGTAAALQGIEVAGKTGTAEKNVAQRINQPWFIAFAPIDHPRIAVAVTIESVQGGFGGPVAGPVAKNVIEQLLGAGA